MLEGGARRVRNVLRRRGVETRFAPLLVAPLNSQTNKVKKNSLPVEHVEVYIQWEKFNPVWNFNLANIQGLSRGLQATLTNKILQKGHVHLFQRAYKTLQFFKDVIEYQNAQNYLSYVYLENRGLILKFADFFDTRTLASTESKFCPKLYNSALTVNKKNCANISYQWKVTKCNKSIEKIRNIHNETTILKFFPQVVQLNLKFRIF